MDRVFVMFPAYLRAGAAQRRISVSAPDLYSSILNRLRDSMSSVERIDGRDEAQPPVGNILKCVSRFGDIAAVIRINKYEGTPRPICYRRWAREKRDRDGVQFEKHRMLRYSPSSGDPRIQSTEWLNISLGYRPEGGETRSPRVRVSREREAGDIFPLSKLFLFFFPVVLYFYLGNRPASPYKLPFVPLISPRPLARTYLIRINARAAWKLASRPVRARHRRSPSHLCCSLARFSFLRHYRK